MAELITLEGKAQQKGKKVVGYKFPDNLDELKFPFKLLYHPNQADGLNDNKNAKVYVKLVKNEKGDNLQSKEGDLLNLSKYSFDKTKVVISPEKLSVDVSADASKVSPKETPLNTSNTKTNTTSNTTLEKDLNKSNLGKTARKVQIGFSVVAWGVFGVLAYKFWNKSTTWKVMLSVFGAYNLYSTYKVFNKPALKVDDSSDLGVEKEIGKETNSNPKNDKLTKQQKIDLIITNMNSRQGAETSPEDEQNTRAYLNLLQPVTLDRWVRISKALNDSEINSAMETNQQQGFALLKSKYGLRQQDLERDMQGLMNFLMGSVDSAINNSAFSNFENTLNLDL